MSCPTRTLTPMTANPGDPDVRAEAPSATAGRRPADTFSNRLLLARALAGHLSIREAADLTGLNREAWRDWERGRRPRDILDVCRRVADAMEVDHDWLLFGGPLAGPHGPSTGRSSRDTPRYPRVAVRPMDNRPNGRPLQSAPNPATRRPVRIQWSDRAAA